MLFLSIQHFIIIRRYHLSQPNAAVSILSMQSYMTAILYPADCLQNMRFCCTVNVNEKVYHFGSNIRECPW
jgi:hypothetical protein